MTEPTPRPDDRQAKDRLLDAAEELFAAKGFSSVSVRELAAAAEVNVAAINYHFTSKDNLFREVITRRFTAQRDRTLTGLRNLLEQTSGQPKVAQVVRVLVHEYLDGAMSNGFLMMITREMHSGQSATHAEFFKQMVAPVFAAMCDALIAARPKLTPEDLSWIIASIVGQVHHFILRRIKCESCGDQPEVREIMRRAFPALALPQDEYIRVTTDHITRFSTAAIDGLYPEGN